ncbi:uncharacterized protein LOC144667461 isoform X2 [Oculina patagonica]
MEFQTTWKSLCFLVIFLTVNCCDVTSQSQDSWLKVNSRPVCFGARDNQYGSFSVPYGGKIAGFKLVYLSGYVSCDTNNIAYWSFWGCYNHPSVKNGVATVITTTSNAIIVPLSQFFTYGAGKWSDAPGYTPRSPEIVLPRFSPYSVNSGQQFRLWYGEDLVGYTESDNGGNVCADVYALYL